MGKKLTETNAIDEIEAFRFGMDEDAHENRVFSANKRDNLYQRIAAAYGIANQLHSDTDLLDFVLKEHGLKRDARKGTNPWVPCVNVLFGKWKEADKSGAKRKDRTFNPDRSAWKYASTFRYLGEHQVQPDKAYEYISEFNMRAYGKGLIGIQKADKDAFGSIVPEQPDEIDDLRFFLEKAEPVDVSNVHELLAGAPVESGEFIAVWGHVVEGKLRLFGALPKGGRKAASRAAIEAAKDVKRFINEEISFKEKKRKKTPTYPRSVSDTVYAPFRKED